MTGPAGVLSSFHDSLGDALYVFDTSGVLVDANARVGEVSGLPTAEMLGTTHEELLDEYGANETTNRGRAAYRAVASGDEDRSRVEFELRNVHGDVVPVDVRYARHDEYVVAILRNLTAVRERERELARLSEQLEVLNRVLRHDIRNDMNVVAGWLDELGPHVDAGGADALANVRDAVSHTIALTTEARDLAEVLIQGGEMPVEPIQLDVVLRQQVEKTRRKYPDATVRVDGDVPAVAVVANQMLSSVFDNLLGNAIVHNDREEPTVVVDATLTAADDADAVVVHVADDGPGIPDAMQESLFGRGEKGVDSPGTGMGLYLVDRLVSGYGGDVHVEPNDSRGTVFTVTIPVADD
ncbi:PAS domain-containing sensor histidine kinase [Halorubellus salinus]|uniref:PAS domain-containing sensor histidine kinase n=1 Tax=Halorubellus salinus TaxID=755309 RepID=UPI001D0606AE|nr:PAS domain-containing sensor histidine kinase [Halorubellus salinus]